MVTKKPRAMPRLLRNAYGLAIRIRSCYRTTGPHAGFLHLCAGDRQATIGLMGFFRHVGCFTQFSTSKTPLLIEQLHECMASALNFIHIFDKFWCKSSIALYCAAILRFSFGHWFLPAVRCHFINPSIRDAHTSNSLCATCKAMTASPNVVPVNGVFSQTCVYTAGGYT